MAKRFDSKKHIFKSAAFQSVVKEGIDFFNGTPTSETPVPESFAGPGVYAIYYLGGFKDYSQYVKANKKGDTFPIYVGKAVPPGSRQGRILGSESNVLFNRIREHSRSIDRAGNIELDDFSCRFMILNNEMSDLIVSIESALIRKYRPLWNSIIDGFGNHDPGAGRRDQAISEWDVLHPGRSWVKLMTGPKPKLVNVRKKLANYKPTLS